MRGTRRKYAGVGQGRAGVDPQWRPNKSLTHENANVASPAFISSPYSSPPPVVSFVVAIVIFLKFFTAGGKVFCVCVCVCVFSDGFPEVIWTLLFFVLPLLFLFFLERSCPESTPLPPPYNSTLIARAY